MKKTQNCLMLTVILFTLSFSHALGQASQETSLTDASRNLISRHLRSFQANDLKAVMNDYTNQSVLVTQVATYRGLQEIETFFAGLLIYFPKQKSDFVLDQTIIHGELIYIVWHAKTPSLEIPLGSDTFIIKDGKIFQQTFVGQLNFIKS